MNDDERWRMKTVCIPFSYIGVWADRFFRNLIDDLIRILFYFKEVSFRKTQVSSYSVFKLSNLKQAFKAVGEQCVFQKYKFNKSFKRNKVTSNVRFHPPNIHFQLIIFILYEFLYKL